MLKNDTVARRPGRKFSTRTSTAEIFRPPPVSRVSSNANLRRIYTHTILRTWGAFSRPPMPIYAVGIAQVPSVNTPTIRSLLHVDAGLLANNQRHLRIGPTQALNATYKINPSPWNGTQPILRRCLRIRAEIYAWSKRPYARIFVDSFAHFGCVRTAYGV